MSQKTGDQARERDEEVTSRTNGERTAERSKPAGVGRLHRALGNQAVRELHERGDLQARFELSRPGDRAEREAERVADEVTGGRSSGSVAASAPDAGRAAPDGATALDAERERAVRSVTRGGSRLPSDTREFFEERFGRDFSDVRVHTGSEADAAARSIGAEAFTLGSDVVFADGTFQPRTDRGKELVAHELTHVVQQTDPPERAARVEGSGETDRAGRVVDPETSVSRSTGTVQRQFGLFGDDESESESEFGQATRSPDDLSKDTLRVLETAGYDGASKLPKTVVDQAREIAAIEQELADDRYVTFYVWINALLANAYPDKDEWGNWTIRFEGGVGDETGYNTGKSVAKDLARMGVEELVNAPNSVTMPVDYYSVYVRNPRLSVVHEVKTGGPAGEEERAIAEAWEQDVLWGVLLDTKEKRMAYNTGKRTMRRKDGQRVEKLRELAQNLETLGVSTGVYNQPSISAAP